MTIKKIIKDIKRLSFSPTAIVQVQVLHGYFGNNTVSGFYGRPSRKALREELRSDHVDELAVFLNSKATKEEIRIAGTKLSAAY